MSLLVTFDTLLSLAVRGRWFAVSLAMSRVFSVEVLVGVLIFPWYQILLAWELRGVGGVPISLIISTHAHCLLMG